MFSICIFDLDETLVRTEDMKELRDGGKHDVSRGYMDRVRAAYATRENRNIYSRSTLDELRREFPKQKFCIFTRSPRSYALTVLALAFPGFQWDLVVANEDVDRTKPYRYGIEKCMQKFNVDILQHVVLVGDGDIDVRAAYHAGCVVILDQTGWPSSRSDWSNEHWNALGHIPDAVIKSPNELRAALSNFVWFLPELERRLTGLKEWHGGPRFDRVNKFIPREAGGDNTPFPIFTSGRSFSNYDSLKSRKSWHALTASIHDNKEAEVFPSEWVATVRLFLYSQFSIMSMRGGDVTISVIPHRPGRSARLEMFLLQLQADYLNNPGEGKLRITFAPALLAYKVGVRSNSNDKLSPLERFENVRDHLYVVDKSNVRGKHLVVIDDVSTTGSTLIYAKKYLGEAGAMSVKCFSIAMNVSNVL